MTFLDQALQEYLATPPNHLRREVYERNHSKLNDALRADADRLAAAKERQRGKPNLLTRFLKLTWGKR